MRFDWLIGPLFEQDLRELTGLRGRALRAGRVAVLAFREFRLSFCFERAAALTFASVISIIPLAVLFFSLARLFPEGDQISSFVQEKVIAFLAPELAEKIDPEKLGVAGNVFSGGLLNLAAFLGLLLGAFSVLVTAERVFNRIWHVRSRRSYLQKLTAFWVILTVSPFLIAVSIGIQDFFDDRIKQLPGPEWLKEFFYDVLLPVLIGFFAFLTVYVFLPHTRVKLRSAAIGGIVAAILWEVSKQAFVIYAHNVTTYASFYGKIAAIPLFLIWLYVTWLVVLLGGEICYVHQNLAILSRQLTREAAPRRFSLVVLGLYLIVAIGHALRRGQGLPELEDIATELGVDTEHLQAASEALQKHGTLVAIADAPGQLALASHPARVHLGKVAEALRQQEFPGEHGEEFAVSAVPAGVLSETERKLYGQLVGQAQDAYVGAFGDLTLEDVTAPRSSEPTSVPEECGPTGEAGLSATSGSDLAQPGLRASSTEIAGTHQEDNVLTPEIASEDIGRD